MGYSVFLFVGDIPKTKVSFVSDEDGIVAEAIHSSNLVGDLPFANPVKEKGLRIFALKKANRAMVTSFAVFLAFK